MGRTTGAVSGGAACGARCQGRAWHGHCCHESRSPEQEGRRDAMKQQDIEMLTPSERRLLDSSFQPNMVRLRYRTILIGAVLMLAGVFIAAARGLAAVYLALIAAGIIIAAAAEKLSYARVLLQFEV